MGVENQQNLADEIWECSFTMQPWVKLKIKRLPQAVNRHDDTFNMEDIVVEYQHDKGY